MSKEAKLFVERSIQGWLHSDAALIVALIALGHATGLSVWWLVLIYLGVGAFTRIAAWLVAP